MDNLSHDLRLFGLLWVTVKRLFNKDHNIKAEAVFEGGKIELNYSSDNIPDKGIVFTGYRVIISSPAGQIMGEGKDLIDAFSDAIKTIQK